MSLPIYQRVAVTDAGDVIPGAEYTVINENTGVAAPIYSDRTGATLLSAPYFADSAGTIQFFIAQGTTFRVAASGGVGTYTDRYVYGVAEAVLVQADGSATINRVGSDGSALTIQKNGTTVGSIGTSGSRPYIANPTYGGLSVADYRINPANSSGVAWDNALDLGAGGSRWKDLYLSGTANIGGNLNLSANDSYVGFPSNGIYYNNSSDHISVKTAATERLRIDSSGNVLFGCTSVPDGTNVGMAWAETGDEALKIGDVGTGGSYQIRFYNGNGNVGNIITSGSSTAYATSSDYRLKEDDVPMTGATERVKALRPINFAWKADGSRVDGFFAHEVQEVVPEAAQGTKDAMMDEEYKVTPAVYEYVITPAVEAVLDENGVVITEAVEESTESVLVTEAVMGTRSVPDYQGIDQSKLVPLLTATIQELIARIEALESGA